MMLAKTEVTPTIDFTAIKEKQRATWGSGDYGRIGVTLQVSGEQLCESMDLRSGQSVLDVASGNGNATLNVVTATLARRILFVTLLMMAATFGVFNWELARGASLNIDRRGLNEIQRPA